MSSKAYLTWALNKEGNLVPVDEVPNGNDCGCVCPHCKGALCAKNGGDSEKMIHHFAHLSGADCVGAVESALHLMAKEILLETKSVYLPNRNDERNGDVVHFDRVEVEFYDKDTQLRPDCIGYYDEKSLWVEFKRTHAVDTKKRGKIISAHIDCVEIDLNGCPLDPIVVKDFITNSAENRKWIRDISVSTRRAGHSSGKGSCDRYEDYYDEYRHLNRTYAKDENGHLVNLMNDDANMNEHSYYCLACGKDLTIDVDEVGGYCFVHIEGEVACDDELYLHEAAKEVLYDRFSRCSQFLIEVPQYYNCAEKSTCVYCNEELCFKEDNIQYDIIKHGYLECLKNYMFSDTQYKFDLVFKRPDSLDNAIFVRINSEYSQTDYSSSGNRIIEISIDSEQSLYELTTQSLGGINANFINFKRDGKKTVPRTIINRSIAKFELYSSGKYFTTRYNCANIEKHKKSTVYEMIFVKGDEDEYDDTYYDFNNIKVYSLLRCHQLKKKACYCEICFFIDEAGGFLTEKICKRYKTKGTPHYPLKEMPVDCPYFSINRNLAETNKERNNDIKVIEKDYEVQ